MSKIYDELQQIKDPCQLLHFLDRLKVSTPWYGGRYLILEDDEKQEKGSLAIRHIVKTLLSNKEIITETAMYKIKNFSKIANYELENASGVSGWFKRFGTWWRQFSNLFLRYNENECVDKIQKSLPKQDREDNYWIQKFDMIAKKNIPLDKRVEEIYKLSKEYTGYAYVYRGPIKKINSDEVKKAVEKYFEDNEFIASRAVKEAKLK